MDLKILIFYSHNFCLNLKPKKKKTFCEIKMEKLFLKLFNVKKFSVSTFKSFSFMDEK